MLISSFLSCSFTSRENVATNKRKRPLRNSQDVSVLLQAKMTPKGSKAKKRATTVTYDTPKTEKRKEIEEIPEIEQNFTLLLPVKGYVIHPIAAKVRDSDMCLQYPERYSNFYEENILSVGM